MSVNRTTKPATPTFADLETLRLKARECVGEYEGLSADQQIALMVICGQKVLGGDFSAVLPVLSKLTLRALFQKQLIDCNGITQHGLRVLLASRVLFRTSKARRQ